MLRVPSELSSYEVNAFLQALQPWKIDLVAKDVLRHFIPLRIPLQIRVIDVTLFRFKSHPPTSKCKLLGYRSRTNRNWHLRGSKRNPAILPPSSPNRSMPTDLRICWNWISLVLDSDILRFSLLNARPRRERKGWEIQFKARSPEEGMKFVKKRAPSSILKLYLLKAIIIYESNGFLGIPNKARLSAWIQDSDHSVWFFNEDSSAMTLNNVPSNLAHGFQSIKS